MYCVLINNDEYQKRLSLSKIKINQRQQRRENNKRKGPKLKIITPLMLESSFIHGLFHKRNFE